MNQKDRERITRLYSIIENIPFPASGSKSTTISGIAGYTQDMREMTPAIIRVLSGMCYESLNNPEFVVDEDYKDPDRMLLAMETWIKRRNQDQWEGRAPELMQFYKPDEESKP